MKETPIVINNLNRLSTTKKLVEDLQRLGYYYIHILDNDSTYPPLLEWYEELRASGEVDIYSVGKSSNQLALWNSGYISTLRHYDYIVYTDSDIELNPDTPDDFIEQLINIAQSSKIEGVNKIGLALKIDDLPNTEMSKFVINHESQFWNNKCMGEVELYNSDIDTTFAVIDPKEPFTYKALRVAGNFTCKHIPWYTDFGNLTEEEKYVLEHTDGQISTHKRHYQNFLNSQLVQ